MKIKKNYDFERGLFEVLMKVGADLDEQECMNQRFRVLSESSVMKKVFGGMYKSLTRDGEMKGMEDQPIEYKQELWDIANQYMPSAMKEDKVHFCKCIMSTLWLMNN